MYHTSTRREGSYQLPRPLEVSCNSGKRERAEGGSDTFFYRGQLFHSRKKIGWLPLWGDIVYQRINESIKNIVQWIQTN